MILLLILLVLFPQTGFCEKLPTLKARVNINTGEVDNVGRGMDYTDLLTPDHRIFPVPNGIDTSKLIYSQGEIREKNVQELDLVKKEIEKRILAEKLINRKQRLDALQGLAGINWGSQVSELQQEINDLRNDYNDV